MTEGVGPYTCHGILQEMQPPVKLARGTTKYSFILQVGTQRLLIEAYDTVGEALLQLAPKSSIEVTFVIKGWQWYPPQGEPRYILRLVAQQITPIPL